MKLRAESLIFGSILIASILGCSETNIPPLAIRDTSDVPELDEPDDDTLILPYQTTGSFLTMFCKWEDKGNSTKDASTLCRIEDDTKVKQRVATRWDAKVSGSSIITSFEALPFSGSKYNARVRFKSGYDEEVRIFAELTDYGKQLSVKPTMFSFTNIPAYLTGKPFLFDENTLWETAKEQLDDFLSPEIFCSEDGKYHTDKNGNNPRVDFREYPGGLGQLAGYCGKGLGTVADWVIGAFNSNEDGQTDFAGLCSHQLQKLEVGKRVPGNSSQYCKMEPLKSRSSNCSVLSVAKIDDYREAKQRAEAGNPKDLNYKVFVFAMSEIAKEPNKYTDISNLPMDYQEISAFSETIPNCNRIVY